MTGHRSKFGTGDHTRDTLPSGTGDRASFELGTTLGTGDHGDGTARSGTGSEARAQGTGP
ncbi:hypothetical protein AMK26_23765 [Streptomyces sp. CB03234]|nr:hypothetical protein AMK26_23765 [Streptomyces sp. CB03234]